MKDTTRFKCYLSVMVTVGFMSAGCAYNSVSITAQGNVTCNASVDKPTSVTNAATATDNTVPIAP